MVGQQFSDGALGPLAVSAVIIEKLHNRYPTGFTHHGRRWVLLNVLQPCQHGCFGPLLLCCPLAFLAQTDRFPHYFGVLQKVLVDDLFDSLARSF
jgi:hypothetical protein